MSARFALPNDPHAIDVATDEDGNPVGTDPAYAGVEFRSNLGGLVQESYGDQVVAQSGVFGDRHFKITLRGTTALAGGGQAALGSLAGVYLASMNGAATLGELRVADSAYSRIDRVVLRVDDPSNGGQGDRRGYVEIIDGTPAPSPVVPAVVGTDVWVDLAEITVPRNGAGVPSVRDTRKLTVATGGVRRVMASSEVTSAVPVGGIVYDDQANKFQARKRTGFVTLQEVEDTGWVNLSDPSSGWDVREPLQARKRNGAVYLCGAVSNLNFEGGFTRILTVPKQFMPSRRVSGETSSNSATNRTVEMRTDGGLYVWHGAKTASWDWLSAIPPYLAD